MHESVSAPWPEASDALDLRMSVESRSMLNWWTLINIDEPGDQGASHDHDAMEVKDNRAHGGAIKIRSQSGDQ